MNDISSSTQEQGRPLSLRERKKRLAQVTIEEAALRLFQQKGYEHTSIQDIADAVMMSTRTFFRYFASKEEVLFGPMREAQNESIRSLKDVPPTASPQAALRAILASLVDLYQQQQDNFLIRYQVAMQTPSVASMYLYALMTMEPEMRDILCSHLKTAVDRQEVRFLVGIYMTALRLACEDWLEHEAREELASLLEKYLGYFPSLVHHA